MNNTLEIMKTAIAGVLVLKPAVFGDDRGFFLESFHGAKFRAATGVDVEFVQDNHSRSSKGVLRGLHYQEAPYEQGKLVRVTQGSVFDVAVDIRRDSPTFGRWVGVELSSQNYKQMWIPPGLAHGFLVTSESAEVQYKATSFYQPAFERCLKWDDQELGIEWPALLNPPLLAAKDQQAPSFRAYREEGAAHRTKK